MNQTNRSSGDPADMLRVYFAPSPLARFRLAVGVLGLGVATVMFLWLLLGALGVMPSMIEVFGVTGLRIPTGAAVGGLLLAAIGFNEF